MDHCNLILDIIAAAIIIGGIISGTRKGFLRTVLTLAVYLIAVIGSAVISDRMSGPLYDEYCKEPIVSAVETEIINTEEQLKNALSQALENNDDVSDEAADNVDAEENNLSDIGQDLTNPEISDTLNNVAENVFDSFRAGLDNILPVAVSDKLVYDDMKIDLFNYLVEGDTRSAAEYIEETAVRNPVIKVIEYVLWTVSFIIITAAGKVIVRTVLAVRKIELVKSADIALGGVLGLFKSLLVISLMVIIIKLIIGITGGIGALSEEAVQNTVLFKFIYNLFDI